jgi:hypothetical protein
MVFGGADDDTVDTTVVPHAEECSPVCLSIAPMSMDAEDQDTTETN